MSVRRYLAGMSQNSAVGTGQRMLAAWHRLRRVPGGRMALATGLRGTTRGIVVRLAHWLLDPG